MSTQSAATPVVAAKPGLSRAQPAPLGETVVAGPVELHVREIIVGADAVAAVLAASGANAAPREGMTYVAVRLAARNVGTSPLWLDNDDFAVTGDSDLLYRFLGALPPEPALDFELAPGEAAEGWVTFGVPADG